MSAYSTKQAADVLVAAARSSSDEFIPSHLKRWLDQELVLASIKPGDGRGTSRTLAFFDLLSARVLVILHSDRSQVVSLRKRRISAALYAARGRPLELLHLHGDLTSERWAVTGSSTPGWEAPAAVRISLGYVATELREASSRAGMPVPDVDHHIPGQQIHTGV